MEEENKTEMPTSETKSACLPSYTPKSLEKIYWDNLKEEGITKEDLELVDLAIAYSPVIAMRGEKFEDAVEAIPCVGSKTYLIKHPIFTNAVDEETLKIMRYRYLVNRPKPRWNFGV